MNLPTNTNNTNSQNYQYNPVNQNAQNISPLSPTYPQYNQSSSATPSAPFQQQYLPNNTASVSPEVPATSNNEAVRAPEVAESTPSTDVTKSERSTSNESHLLKPTSNLPAVPKQQVQSAPQDGLEVLGIKLYGYRFSTQLANMKNSFMNMSGRGNPVKAKSWLIMLLDRLLKIESMKKV